jgi:hypothetical protein
LTRNLSVFLEILHQVRNDGKNKVESCERLGFLAGDKLTDKIHDLSGNLNDTIDHLADKEKQKIDELKKTDSAVFCSY